MNNSNIPMATWFKTNSMARGIESVTVVKVTESSVSILPYLESKPITVRKSSQTHRFFPEYEEAYEWLHDIATAKVARLEKELREAKERVIAIEKGKGKVKDSTAKPRPTITPNF